MRTPYSLLYIYAAITPASFKNAFFGTSLNGRLPHSSYKDRISSRLHYGPSWKSGGQRKNGSFRQIYPSRKVARSVHVLLIPDIEEECRHRRGSRTSSFSRQNSLQCLFWNKDLMSLQDGGDTARGQRIQLSARVLREPSVISILQSI